MSLVKVGDLVRLNDIGCFHPDDEYLSYGVVVEIERDRYDIGNGPILRDEGCHIRWDDGRITVEPIQFIEKVHADVVE